MITTEPVKLGPIAHGGHCVARIDGRVVFVRHGIPGELVRVRITDDSKPRFWWGEVEEVIQPSPDRVDPPCPVAGICGGCDFQEISLSRQRELKSDVIAEQLRRLAGLEMRTEVEAVPGDEDGLGWRTRMRYLVQNGRIGLRAWRSSELVELPEHGCRIAHPDGRSGLADLAVRMGDNDELQVVISDDGRTVLNQRGQVLEGSKIVTQYLGQRSYQVQAGGFWQIHPGAAKALTAAVTDGLEPRPGDSVVDLYCGCGLFAGALVDRGCQVTGIEANKAAIALARRNVPQARFHAVRMEQAGNRLPSSTDLIVLDPPRTGAGINVVKRLVQLKSRAIAYVACDPAALARDLAAFASLGYELHSLRALDLFPMTHHVECVAILKHG